MKEDCGKCKYVWVNEVDEPICRRFPPTWVSNGFTGKVDVKWPWVDETWWCGEFKARPKGRAIDDQG